MPAEDFKVKYKDEPKIVIAPKSTENLAATFLSTPKNIAVEITRPDLEKPGIKAITWISPIRSDVLYPRLELIEKNFNDSTDIKIKPVIKNPKIVTM